MTIAVRVTASDPTPPYEQLRRQLSDAIDSGLLESGTRLPTVRQLASDLGIAPGTVMRAYSELEASGHVRTGRGSGTVVNERPRPADPSGVLTELTRAFATRALATGASPEAILDAVARHLRHPG